MNNKKIRSIYINGEETDYKIDIDGNVYSMKDGDKIKILKPYSYKNHLRVNLCHDGQIFTKYINRLVTEAFFPNNIKKKCDVNKICKMLECGISISEVAKRNNVSYGYVYEIFKGKTNQKISKKYKIKNAKHNIDRLNEKSVKHICELLENGERMCDISRKLNINYYIICGIRCHKNYVYISKNYNFDKCKENRKEE